MNGSPNVRRRRRAKGTGRTVCAAQTSGAGYKRMVASRLSLPPSLLTYLLTYLRAFGVCWDGLSKVVCLDFAPSSDRQKLSAREVWDQRVDQRRTRADGPAAALQAIRRQHTHDSGLPSARAPEILLEWVLRTIGSAERQHDIRRFIFNGTSCPALPEAVPRARQCLAENGHPDVAAVIPEHDRKRNGPWKTFEAAAGFDRILQELQQAGQAAGDTQVFSPHELLNRPRGLMQSALRTGRVAAKSRLSFIDWPHTPRR